MKESLSRWSFAGLLIEQRSLGWGLFGGGVLYLLLKLLGWLPSQCPFRTVTGLPCPGCGLTRASMALLRGDWKAAFAYHAFVGVFVILWAVVALGLVMPLPMRERYVMTINRFEHRTRWALWFGVILVLYTLTRWSGMC